MSLFDALSWAEGVARSDGTVKQEHGRTLAARLGFTAGPAGADGGVDGWAEGDGVRAVFFCRLSATPLSVKDAREFAAVLLKRRASVGVAMASPAGYAPGFWSEVADVLDGAGRVVALHRLRHEDVLAETAAFQAARRAVPPGPHGVAGPR